MDVKLLKFLEVLRLIGPSVLAIAVPKSAPFIPTILDAIAEAEQIKGADGATKKAHVLGVLDKSVSVYNGVASATKQINGGLMRDTVSHGIDTVVGVVGVVQGVKQAGPVT